MPLRAVSSGLVGPRGLVGSGLVVHGGSVSSQQEPHAAHIISEIYDRRYCEFYPSGLACARGDSAGLQARASRRGHNSAP